MPQLPEDRRHFTKAVTEFGEKRPVVTTRAIFNAKGIKIVEAGIAVNAGLYERLMQHQLERPLEDSVASTPTVTGKMLRDSGEALLQTFPLFSWLALDEAARNLLLATLERLPLPDPVAFQLALAYEVRSELFQHSVLSSLVAAWLATETKLPKAQIAVAAAAGLLHDVGLLHLDPILLNHKTDIDRAQRRQLYSHPLVSTVLIERHTEYPREVVRAVREHHEFVDGSGYPVGLSGDHISPVGRILALTELIVGSFGPGREAPQLRLSLLLRMNRHRYDEALTEKVLRLLQAHQGAATESIALLDDPVFHLLTIDAVLKDWPADLARQPDLTSQQQQAIKLTASQAAQLHRVLASVGVAPQQLAQLGTDALGGQLQTELTLLAREAAWQLRTLARELGRRWRTTAGITFPPELQAWMDRVSKVVVSIGGSGQDEAADDGHLKASET